MALGPGNTTALAQLIAQYWDEPFERFQNEEASFIKLFSRVKPKNNLIRWHIDANDKNPIWSYAKSAMLDDPRAHLATDGIGTSTLFLAPNVHAVLEANIGMRYTAQTLELDGDTLESIKGKPGAFMNALAREQKRSLADFWKQINDQALDFVSTTSGNAGLNIDGLGVILATGGTTYAGVNYATYPEHAPYVNANGGVNRALTLALMFDVLDALEGFTTSINRQSKVTQIFANTRQFRAYGNLLTAYRRYTSSEKLDAGFPALDFEDRPVVKIPGFNANKMLFYSAKTVAGSDSIEYAVQRNLKAEDKSQQVTDGILIVQTHYSNLYAKGRMHQGVLADLS